ncbi:MAG: S-adenosylmethionine decarboxylase family protein [Nitrospiraceae bacterium]
MKAYRLPEIIYQLAIVARGCRGDLTDNEALVATCQRMAEATGLRVVAQTVHAYVPHGVSVALLLAQSHIVVSTWPEHRLATVDLAACDTSVMALQTAWRELEAYLQPAAIEPSERSIALRLE